MLGRTPGSIEAIRPMREGVIADFDVAEEMIKHFIRKVHKRSTFLSQRLSYAYHTERPLWKKSNTPVSSLSGARKAGLIAEPIAAAIGAACQ